MHLVTNNPKKQIKKIREANPKTCGGAVLPRSVPSRVLVVVWNFVPVTHRLCNIADTPRES